MIFLADTPLAPTSSQRYMMPVTASRIRFEVSPRHEGQRLEQLLRGYAPELTRGSVRRLLRSGGVVWIDGRPASKGQRLYSGQRIEIASHALDPMPLKRADLPLEVIAVADDFVVINKPEGIPTHPLTPGETDTLAGRLVARFPECIEASPAPREGGLVHRLDRGTSGVMIAARDRAAYTRLRQAFSTSRMLKRYLALVQGHLDQPGEVVGEIEGVPGHPERVRLVKQPSDGPSGASPSTRYRPICHIGKHTLITASCTSGRRHQVRVHLASCGYPLVDDSLYGGAKLVGNGLAFLHASALTWDDYAFSAPLSPTRRKVLYELTKQLDGKVIWRG